MWWKMGQWRFLVETWCHSETTEVPLMTKLVLKNMIWFCETLSSFLDLYAHILERFSRSLLALRNESLTLLYDIHPGYSTPVMEEHTKLIDCLSEPSS